MRESMTLKTQLKGLLTQKGMTAADLARASGVPRQSISDWLAGTKPRNIEHIKKVADILGVSLELLLFSEEPKPKAERDKVADLDSLLGDQWLSGVFEIRVRRVRK